MNEMRVNLVGLTKAALQGHELYVSMEEGYKKLYYLVTINCSVVRPVHFDARLRTMFRMHL